jgi:hypothetical protein
VKVEHRHPIRLLQSIQIPLWKWEVISMDFITGFPKTVKKHDAIMVVVDKLSKVLDTPTTLRGGVNECGDLFQNFPSQNFLVSNHHLLITYCCHL